MTSGKVGHGSVVFVPGIMGSELRLQGRGSNGIVSDQFVWGEDFVEVLWNLARCPEVLGSPDLVATSVIREVRLGRFKVREIYGPLLEFCTSTKGLQLVEGRSLYPFAYDWRLDLTGTARRLAALVEQVPGPVFIVAHSLGGLLTWIMLNLGGPAAARVRGVFGIACPFGGSAKAFTTLMLHPNLGPVSDWLCYLFHLFSPDKRVRLMDALKSMYSMYQLLPPMTEKILLQSGGIQRSALEAFRGPRDERMVEAALNVHQSLTAIPLVLTTGVYSTQLPTPWLLAVNENWIPVASGMKAEGDGTITSASALAGSGDNVAFRGVGAEHTRLCSRKDVHEALRSFLS